MNLHFRLMLISLFLFSLPISSYARSSVAGWDFDIVRVSSSRTIVHAEVCSRSQHGLNGPVMIICNVRGKDFVNERVHFNSGNCKTATFSIPPGSLFPEHETAGEIAGSRPPGRFRHENAQVCAKGGGLAGIGYGWWQFDYWSGTLDFKY